jgi:hypothetical protein
VLILICCPPSARATVARLTPARLANFVRVHRRLVRSSITAADTRRRTSNTAGLVGAFIGRDAIRADETTPPLKEAKSRYFQAHCECVTGVKVPPPCPEVIPTQPTAVQPSVGSPAAVESAALSTPSNVVPTPTPRPAAAPAPARQQCAATTKKGTRCARLASVGSAFCWQHGR